MTSKMNPEILKAFAHLFTNYMFYSEWRHTEKDPLIPIGVKVFLNPPQSLERMRGPKPVPAVYRPPPDPKDPENIEGGKKLLREQEEKLLKFLDEQNFTSREFFSVILQCDSHLLQWWCERIDEISEE